MGNVLKKISGPSLLRGGYTASTPNVQNLAAASTLNSAAKKKRFWIFAFIITAVVVIMVGLSLRSQYAPLINDLTLLYGSDGTKLAYKIALVKTYPFLRPLFFNNPSTADVVSNTYFGAIQNADPSIIGGNSLSDKDKAYTPGLSCIFYKNGPLVPGSNGTIYGYLELDSQAGWDDIWQACTEKRGFFGSQEGGWVNAEGSPCCPTNNATVVGNDFQTIFQYAVPVIGMLLIAM